MSHIILDQITKTYSNGNTAVHPSTIHVEQGEFLVLVGPSGCGKSTLLRMIAGLEDITNGSLQIAGRVVNDVNPADRDIAMVFQNYALYPHMSVRKNIGYGLKNRGIPSADIDAKIAEATKLLDLEPYLDRKPSQLSGGQRQRVAMGRAIVRDPALFLFDEPLSNLDAKLRNQMRIEVKALQRRLGTTAIYVTHDQVEAMTMADRIVVLNGGHIEQIGTPSEIYHNPATTFVASFMGAPPMNLLDGHVRNGMLELANGAELGSGGNAPIGELLVGIRPEDIDVQGQGYRFELDLAEQLGANQLLHGRLEDQAFTINVSSEFVVNAPVMEVGIKPEKICKFDKSSGLNIN